jgi:hypothetical protein
MRMDFRAGIILGVFAVGLAFSGQAFAAPDKLYPKPGTVSWTVNGAPNVDVTNILVVGDDGSTELNPPVSAGAAISVAATFAILDRSAQAGTDTVYDRTVAFNTATLEKPAGAPDVSVTPIPNCVATSSATECPVTIAFNAPATPGRYEVEVEASSGGSTGLAGGTLDVIFTVEAECEIGGKLDPVCTFTTVEGVTSVRATWCDVIPDADKGGETRYAGDLEQWLDEPETWAYIDGCDIGLSRGENEDFGYTCDGETCVGLVADLDAVYYNDDPELDRTSQCTPAQALRFAIFKVIEGVITDDDGNTYARGENEQAKLRVECTAAAE